MADNDSSNPATEGNQSLTGTGGVDTLTGGLGDDIILGQDGDDVIAGDGPVLGAWHFETFDFNFSSAAGQAFDIESGTRTASGYVTDFDEGNLTNTVRGTTGSPEDFGVIYTSTLNVAAGGTYRFTTTSDDGSTIQIFDSSGTPLNFANQTGGTLDYMNNDFHQGPTTRFGDVVLSAGETYTIQIRYWENGGGDVLSATVSGPDTGGSTDDLLTSSMLGLPPGPEYSVTGTPAGIEGDDTLYGGDGADTISGNGGDDVIYGDSSLAPPNWSYAAYDFDFSSAAGQAFDIESGTLRGTGTIDNFDESALINSLRGTTGNPEDFGIIYSNTIEITTGGTYRFATTSDDGSTIQIFDSSGTPLNFANQTGGTLPYMNNDFHQGPTTRFGDVVLAAGETYTIELRYWENAGGDVLSATVSGPDTGGSTEDLLTTSLLGSGAITAPTGAPASSADIIDGGEGNDTIFGELGDDVIDGGDGDDTITGGSEDDTLTGGDGNDTFIFNAGDDDDTITDFNFGNTGSINDGNQSNNDFVDLSSFYTNIFELREDFEDNGVLDQSVGDFSDNTALGGSLSFTGLSDKKDLTFDNVNVLCIARGAVIETNKGEQTVETLLPGTLVRTRDHGFQPLRLIVSRRLTRAQLDTHENLRPIRIMAGALGLNLPHCDLLTSRQHRMLISSKVSERMFGSREVLVAAHKLIQMPGIFIDRDIEETEYFHLIFDRHEVIYANGAPTESLAVTGQSWDTLPDAAKHEIQTLFPYLCPSNNAEDLFARPVPKSSKQSRLVERLLKNNKPAFESDDLTKDQSLTGKPNQL